MSWQEGDPCVYQEPKLDENGEPVLEFTAEGWARDKKPVMVKCINSVRTRGLCHSHYQAAQRGRRNGYVTEEDLVERGLMLPKGAGAAKVSGHSSFRLGSTVRGKA